MDPHTTKLAIKKTTRGADQKATAEESRHSPEQPCKAHHQYGWASEPATWKWKHSGGKQLVLINLSGRLVVS